MGFSVDFFAGYAKILKQGDPEDISQEISQGLGNFRDIQKTFQRKFCKVAKFQGDPKDISQEISQGLRNFTTPTKFLKVTHCLIFCPLSIPQACESEPGISLGLEFLPPPHSLLPSPHALHHSIFDPPPKQIPHIPSKPFIVQTFHIPYTL